ncbi:hypothetical protein DWB63_00470 [Pseudodesulfovibrio sp. S3]|nr:hypothetical protein DWB63_00470 [Pseudodesulfovibrio sp. S3]
MSYLQVTFYLTFLCTGSMVWRMWLLYREYRLPGVLWLVIGYSAISLTALAAAVSGLVGEWTKTFLAHLFFMGGFGAIWLGTRLFLGELVGRRHYLFVAAVLGLSGFGIFWFWLIDPVYQIRIAIGCIVLLAFSLVLSQKLFSVRFEQRAVTIAGSFYSLFAFINGVRTIDILLNPAPDEEFISGSVATALTSVMIISLFAAQAATIFMIREEARISTNNPE